MLTVPGTRGKEGGGSGPLRGDGRRALHPAEGGPWTDTRIQEGRPKGKGTTLLNGRGQSQPTEDERDLQRGGETGRLTEGTQMISSGSKSKRETLYSPVQAEVPDNPQNPNDDPTKRTTKISASDPESGLSCISLLRTSPSSLDEMEPELWKKFILLICVFVFPDIQELPTFTAEVQS